MEPRDVPPRWEGLDESQELRPYQEPGWRGKTRDGEMCRGEVTTRALHEWILLSRYDTPTILKDVLLRLPCVDATLQVI